VVNVETKLVGVVSIGDVAGEASEEMVVEALDEISMPTGPQR
jgi:hypothetical protein